MDAFGVPKKINRHVLKALYYMKDRGYKKPELSEICELVEISMRNNVPVRDLHGVVRQSLQNMAQLGVIEKSGTNFFFVRNANTSPEFPEKPDRRAFNMNDRKTDGSKLDPNMKRRRDASCDSMSGSDIEKARKRFRTKNTVSQKGHRVMLPKVRMSRKKFSKRSNMDQESISNDEIYNDEENEEKSDCSLDASVKTQWSSENDGKSDCSLDGSVKTQCPSEIFKNDKDESKTETNQSTEEKKSPEHDEKKNEDQEPNPMIESDPEGDEIVTSEQKVENQPDEDNPNYLSPVTD